jgi:hypothetical protein
MELRAGSPYAVFEDEAAKCTDAEFREGVTRWVELTGNYIRATMSMRKCSQFPESIMGEKRLYREHVFKLEHPPNIAAYIATMQESETKRRMTRAWSLYQFIVNDRNTYFYEEREDLSAIPANLEEIALGQVDAPSEALCRVEVAEVAILNRSAEESNNWNQVAAMTKRYTKPEEHVILEEIKRTLRFLYSDPSIARNAWINYAGFPWVAAESNSPEVLRRYLSFIRNLAQSARAASGKSMTLPPPQFDSSRLKQLSDVELRCSPHVLNSQEHLSRLPRVDGWPTQP